MQAPPCQVKEVKGGIVVFQPDRADALAGLEQMHPWMLGGLRADSAEFLERGTYSPVMKFAPCDGPYEVRRMTYRGNGGWSYPLRVGPLAKLAAVFVSAIGTDSFYELM